MSLMRRLSIPATKVSRCRICLVMSIFALLGLQSIADSASSPWDQPAAALVEQISAILGPGQAKFTLRNASSVQVEDVPAIRKLFEQDLKVRGIQLSGAESANTIQVTLSENSRERLWIAEIVEGNQSQVVMVTLQSQPSQFLPVSGGLLLRKQTVFTSREQLLAILETPNGLVALEPEYILLYARGNDGWHEQERVSIGQKRPLPRDPRGMFIPLEQGPGFEAQLPGIRCIGMLVQAGSAQDPAIHCNESDDPWRLLESDSVGGDTSFSAFYNSARNYFTGVVTPNFPVELPPFYSSTFIARPVGGAALLLGGIDGKVQLMENSTLKSLSGTRDWGSDFAALQSGCGTGTQIISSSSGEAVADSLRAFEIPALEALPASATLAMDGTVTALWTAPDRKSVFVIVRGAANQYEVDRVSALCN